jgi:DNA-binding response OmpR family regulator
MPAIILVEKDEITLDIYRRELSKSFEVLTFTEIEGVLEAIREHPVRAVIIEPEINSGDGWELIHSMQTACPDHSIPVIVCSTRDTSDAHPPDFITKYLTKPVLPKVLREKTLEVLERDRQKKHND